MEAIPDIREGTPIDRLPDELIAMAFSWLDVSSLVRCARVSRRWRRISEDEATWKAVARFIYRGACELKDIDARLWTKACQLPGFLCFIEGTVAKMVRLRLKQDVRVSSPFLVMRTSDTAFSIQAWTGREIRKIQTEAPIKRFALDRDQLFAWCGDHIIRRWNCFGGQELSSMAWPTELQSASMHAQEGWLVLWQKGIPSKAVHLINVKSKRRQAILWEAAKSIGLVAMSKGRLYLGGSGCLSVYRLSPKVELIQTQEWKGVGLLRACSVSNSFHAMDANPRLVALGQERILPISLTRVVDWRTMTPWYPVALWVRGPHAILTDRDGCILHHGLDTHGSRQLFVPSNKPIQDLQGLFQALLRVAQGKESQPPSPIQSTEEEWFPV